MAQCRSNVLRGPIRIGYYDTAIDLREAGALPGSDLRDAGGCDGYDPGLTCGMQAAGGSQSHTSRLGRTLRRGLA